MTEGSFRCAAWDPAGSGPGDSCAACSRSAVLKLCDAHQAVPGNRILSVSHDTLDLLAACGPKPGSPVQIECGDVIILGEVTRAEPQGSVWKIAVTSCQVVRRSAIGPFFLPPQYIG